MPLTTLKRFVALLDYGRALGMALLFVQLSAAQTVFVRGGDVYLTAGGVQRQVTSTGRDADAAMSHDRRSIVFVRILQARTDASGLGKVVEKSEIDFVDTTDPALSARVLLNTPVEAAGGKFWWFSSPQYSSDGSVVYFLVRDYSTVSPGVFSIELQSGRIRFLSDALKFWVVYSGPYEGCLVVWQRPMLVEGGRYDIFNLLSPSGETRGVVGFSESQILANFLNYTNGGR